MFEISGNDISNLSDSDLRSLIVRLAIAELRTKGCPRSSVIAGGNQDAADGGLDVRVECPSELVDPDFIPRRLTGFQVKKPDMPPAAIRNEMRPSGQVRAVIDALANASGAYVIVSSQGSVTDKPLAKRRQAMREALSDVPSGTQLHTDFYDRDRLAIWVNEYPGIVAWVRSTARRPLSGWSGISDWEGARVPAPKPYLSNDKACFIDERSHEREHLTIAEGISRLRAGLRTPKQCIRLIGLSGLGKTRLIQALFEEGVGQDALDSSLAIYTDYSVETDPTARDMARELIANRQRAILVVDNCNPATHSELVRICSSEASQVSLITVEYDVRDDEPESTDVFRLQSASPDLVIEWLKQGFPDISEVDRGKVAEFADGNFRVALALAQTLGKGETLGSLKNRELFERIFRQRNEPDHQLFQAAEDLSLLYSIDGEDASGESELALVGAIRNIGVRPIYEALAELRQRGVVQARGRFRAILPQAIANPLAAQAIDRIPQAHFDQFCETLTPRMMKSLSRRLGLLHDSIGAQAVVARWLRSDGPLGDLLAKGAEGFQILTNIAPAAPEAVLARLTQELDGPNGPLIFSPEASARHQWVSLIKALSYDAKLFDSAVLLLARFHSAGSENRSNYSEREAFTEIFHIYLSGTQAPPEQRRAAIRRLATSNDDCLRRSSQTALRALLKSDHFLSMSNSDFGARSRNWGWEPKIYRDIWDWFENAIKLVIEFASESDARSLLAQHIRGLWSHPPCRNELERAAEGFSLTRPWIEGWIACRATLRYEGKNMPDDVRAQLERFISRLKPTDLLNQARAVVLNRMPGGGGWDFADGEDDEGDAIEAWNKADRMAREVGSALANDARVRREFFPELMAEPQPQRAFQCGRGLAEGADDLGVIWRELTGLYASTKAELRNPTVLGGFLFEANCRDRNFASRSLEALIENSNLVKFLPFFQAQAGIDAEGIARLRRAIASGNLVAQSFYSIANRSVSESPPEPLAQLLEDIATLPEGVKAALEILHMHFFCQRSEEAIEQNQRLVGVGRALLTHADFSKDTPLRDYAAHKIIRICLTGEEGRETTVKLCESLRSKLDDYRVSLIDLNYTLKAVFEVHPFVALDTFLLPTAPHRIDRWYNADLGMKSPIEDLDASLLKKWASNDPHIRYPLLGGCLNMFIKENNDDDKDLSQLFVTILEDAPDKRLFFGDLLDRLHPRSWSGSLANIFARRKEHLKKLGELTDEHVRAYINDIMPELDRWIRNERERDRRSEESFE